MYEGDYRIKVFPYFFKNETGRLFVNVSEAGLRQMVGGWRDQIHRPGDNEWQWADAQDHGQGHAGRRWPRRAHFYGGD